MKAIYVSTMIAVGLGVSGQVLADEALAKAKNCMSCHAVDKKLVGPAYQEVAKKYADQKEAAATLAASIRKGGSGKWGPVPMPAQAALSEADARTLAEWILAGAR